MPQPATEISTPHPPYFPACFVEMPLQAEGRSAAFYLAAEEYIADHFPEDNYLFTWQLAPTVVMGRNQIAHEELNLDFCRAEGIEIVRRKSGGGAIFADRNNIMVSLITGGGEVEPLFREYAERVAAGLRTLGAPAVVAGRNDIVLEGGGKICGNAFYHLPRRNIVHGTMLLDTDPRLMEGALHPTFSKLQSKGVKSVRSRVALLKDFLPMDADRLRSQLRPLLTNRSVKLSLGDIALIEEIERPYHTAEYLFARSAGHESRTLSARIEGCGQLSLHFRLKGSMVEEVAISGDFFETGEAKKAFNQTFKGCTFTPQSLCEAAMRHHPEHTLMNLSKAQLLHLLKSQ